MFGCLVFSILLLLAFLSGYVIGFMATDSNVGGYIGGIIALILFIYGVIKKDNR